MFINIYLVEVPEGELFNEFDVFNQSGKFRFYVEHEFYPLNELVRFYVQSGLKVKSHSHTHCTKNKYAKSKSAQKSYSYSSCSQLGVENRAVTPLISDQKYFKFKATARHSNFQGVKRECT